LRSLVVCILAWHPDIYSQGLDRLTVYRVQSVDDNIVRNTRL
jgi:hypothetical protein